MRVLLTGANGFVGSHVLARLVQLGVPVDVLLRPRAQRDRIHAALQHPEVRVHLGSVTEPATLGVAVRDATHVIHCAGCTKALRREDYDAVNAEGTRHLLEALAERESGVQRFIYVSSLAAARPAGWEDPAAEDDPSRPVTVYGQSKRRGEQYVRELCRCPSMILRPSAVYGPGDADFLNLFRAVRWRVVPLVGGGSQPLSLVYVTDLADVIVQSVIKVGLGNAVPHRVYHVAHPEVVTAAEMAKAVGGVMGMNGVMLVRMPRAVLWAVCGVQEQISRWRGKAHILSLAKYRELVAPGWVCDVRRLEAELGLRCATGLREGLTRTLEWYQKEGWLT